MGYEITSAVITILVSFSFLANKETLTIFRIEFVFVSHPIVTLTGRSPK